MNRDRFLGSPDLHRAAANFAAGYAKRMIDGQYSRIMKTRVGERLHALDRPNKYAVEAALNGLVAYLAAHEQKFASSAVRQFLWEIAKDVPSEISKRILAREHARAHNDAPGIDVEVVQTEQYSVIEGLLKLTPDDLGTFLTWIETATPEERRFMAEAVSQLTEEEQARLAGSSTAVRGALVHGVVSPEQDRPHERTPPGTSGGKALLKSITESLRSINERFEQRDGKP